MSFADEVRELYQEVILDRGRKPRHGQRLAAFDATAKGDNPMCGDRVQVWVKFDSGDTISETGFEARGCAISIASADLMADAIQGRGKADTKALFDSFVAMVRTGVCPEHDTVPEQLAPLSGVHEYPSRVKCATLPWHALNAALEGTREASSE